MNWVPKYRHSCTPLVISDLRENFHSCCGKLCGEFESKAVKFLTVVSFQQNAHTSGATLNSSQTQGSHFMKQDSPAIHLCGHLFLALLCCVATLVCSCGNLSGRY